MSQKQKTTDVIPYSVRFTQADHDVLDKRISALLANWMGELEAKFGRGNGAFSKTKLIRAAVALLEQRSDDEIIEAVERLKKQMWQG